MSPPSLSLSQKGFTLIELTIGILLLSILFIFGANMLTDSLSAAQKSNRSHANAAAARYAIERLSREIRGVSHDETLHSVMISTASPTHMTFTRNSAIGTVNVDIQLIGQTLTLAYPPATRQVLIDHVSAFALAYTDVTAVATQDTTLIQFVDISLSVSAPDAPPLSLRTLVGLRGS